MVKYFILLGRLFIFRSKKLVQCSFDLIWNFCPFEKFFRDRKKWYDYLELLRNYMENAAKHSSLAPVVFVQRLKMGRAWHYGNERQFLCYWLAPVVFLGWYHLNLSIVECKPLNLRSDFVAAAAAQSRLCLCNPTKMITVPFFWWMLALEVVGVCFPCLYQDLFLKMLSQTTHFSSPVLLLVPKTPLTVFDALMWHIYLLYNVPCQTIPIINNYGLYLVIIEHLHWTPERSSFFKEKSLERFWRCRSIKASSSPYTSHIYFLWASQSIDTLSKVKKGKGKLQNMDELSVGKIRIYLFANPINQNAYSQHGKKFRILKIKYYYYH